MDVISGVIMGSAWNMEWWSLWKTRMSWGGQVTYGDIFAILLYRMIGRIRMMTLHFRVLNEESDMGGRTWDRVRGILVKIRCPCGSGVGICTQLCVYVFGFVRIVVYDVGGCHMSIVIDPG